MARPTPRSKSPATLAAGIPSTLSASSAVFRPGRKFNPNTDRHALAQQWQYEAYRHINICGEARYAATLFAAIAGRAEIGVSEGQTLAHKSKWVVDGPEVEALAELAPTVRERTKLIRDYMLHRIIAGECYLIARDRQDTDPEGTDPIWEIVAVTELQKVGDLWRVRHDNGNFIDLNSTDPVIRMWNPDPENRREAWSPFRSLLPTLREIEWLTGHIFTQVRSRMMSAGVWFLPDNLTFAPPPPDSVEGGAEAIAAMNDAEQFMLSLAASSMEMLDAEEVSFPSVVMADAASLAAIDQNKLIKFWSEIDDKAMTLRDDAIRRFALGMDLPPEQVLGAAAMSGKGASGAMNHWGQWALDEQTITSHIEPALDDFVGTLTTAFLRLVVEGTDKIIGYDTTSLRLRPDRSKEAVELYDRGVLKAKVMVREVGFDPENDMMDETEHRLWLLNRIAGGSATPEQVQAALILMGVPLPVAPEAPVSGNDPAPQISDRNGPPSLEQHPYEGPPRGDHHHNEAPFSASQAAAEVLVLRALEKAGNRLLNDGKRGKDRDRDTPAHMAHVVNPVTETPEFDFTLASTVYADLPAAARDEKERQLVALCADLYKTGTAYTRKALVERFGSL